MATATIQGEIFELPPPLNTVLSHYYHLRVPADAAVTVQSLPPDFEMLLVFNFGAPVRISFNKEAIGERTVLRTAVIGPLRKRLNYELKPGDEFIVANFTLNGFYRLFKVPLHEIGDEPVLDPDMLIDKNCFADVWQAAFAEKHLQQRIDLLTRYIAAFVAGNDAAVAQLIKGMPYFKDASIQPVKAIAADTRLTERTVQLRFRKYLGYSPKELLRFLRFKAVVYDMLREQNTPVDLTGLVVTHGYHDQSHLIKDFNYFMGTTPQQFLKNVQNNTYCMPFPRKQY